MHDRNHSTPIRIQEEDFGTLSNGCQAKVYTLENPGGLRVRLTNFGASLVSCEVPDKEGNLADLALGFDSVAGYQGSGNPYFGASVGRFANRIANGRFSLDGETFTLVTNNSPGGIPCHLHGGTTGFSHVLWTAEPSDDGRSITFTYLSRDGEEGYPGNLKVRITYTITDNAELIWEATATTDAPTVVNLVNHTYWNLSGNPSIPITDHELTIFSDRFLPTDCGLIPTGEVAQVAGTPMDFTKARVIGDRIDDDFEALKFGAGYDHCWVLSGQREGEATPTAILKDPKTGRVMEVLTNQPGVQFYTGNWIHEDLFTGENPPGKRGCAYGRRSGCCLETENFPDAPNHQEFPSSVLQPGETYRHLMIHRFSAE